MKPDVSLPAPPGSVYADRDAAREAVDAALPSIERLLLQPGTSGLGVLFLVVMDPGLGPGDVEFEQAVLFEHAVGDRARWDVDYAAFARAKARLSWTRRCSSAQMQAERAHCLRAGDSLLGGAVWLDGIVVAFSGAEPWYDEACALCVAAHLRAVAKRRHAQALKAGACAARPADIFPQPPARTER